MKKSIRKILIANRGEIAIRVMRTCRLMGITTVAVFSDADRQSPHVRFADEAHHIGPPPARESYLDIPRIINTARKCGADAIHPGYGFLSENPRFVEEVEKAGLIFIGPSAASIRLLGDKTSARSIAKELGIPVVPGTINPIESIGEARATAQEIGYPVLLKAAAGGGGKGMRVVKEEGALESSFRMAKSEALSSFSDDRVYMEKFILNPRHIEVQVLADGRGNVVHFGERECSIQRRHQKIIEESPSLAIDDAVRAGLTQAAVRLARHVKYAGAGTVEFIFDDAGRYYFMEVNTRLQVEHPVTELRTGVDLVREQIMVASGEKPGIAQEDVTFHGHAIECRIYAEDSANQFLPYMGRINHIAHPAGPGIRLDTGIEERSEIMAYYDPMISKVIAFGEDRADALRRMRAALERYEIYGVKTNIDLLLWIIGDEDFAAYRFDTNFIQSKYDPAFFTTAPDDMKVLAARIGIHLMERDAERYRAAGDGELSPWAGKRTDRMR